MKVPKLRFKNDDGWEFSDWEKKELKDIAYINPKIHSLPDEFIYIDLESVEKGILLKENKITRDNAPSRAQRLIEKYDVLFQMVRPYQRNNLFFDKTGKYVASTGYAQIRANEDSRFLYYCLHLDNFISEVMNRCTGTSYPAINSNDLASIPLLVPSKPEQTKIANFLTAIDEKITQLTQKCDLLSQYKKGVMQQIFSQKLRFRDDDGQEFPEWEELNFNDGFYLANNKKTQVKSSDYSEAGHIPVVDQGQKPIVGYTNNKDVYDDVPVIIFGDHTRILKWIDFKFAPGADGTQVIKTTKKLNVKFGYYCLCNIELPNLGYSRHMKEMKEQYFFVPICSKEQTKIASFLTAIDEKITQAQAQLEAVKRYKKGLLQQMFV